MAGKTGEKTEEAQLPLRLKSKKNSSELNHRFVSEQAFTVYGTAIDRTI